MKKTGNATEQSQDYGTIVVVGGGCYGSYYVRQLGRAHAAGVIAWDRVLVVDRNPECAVGEQLRTGAVDAPGIALECGDWAVFFDRYLTAASEDPTGSSRDAIVPSPLMPHLMYDWLLARSRRRWPERVVETRRLPGPVAVPWQRESPDRTHYVSFAEWVCPINCIEPALCPHTRETRWWTMPEAVKTYVEGERRAGRELAGPVIFHCTHRAYGVGMFDTSAVVEGDVVVRESALAGAAAVLVGTVSHCHGALNILAIGGERGNAGSDSDRL
jgi:hypothetical protein